MPISKCQVCGFETADLKPWGKDPERRFICAGCGIHKDQIETTLEHLLKEATGEVRSVTEDEIQEFKAKLILRMVKKLREKKLN